MKRILIVVLLAGVAVADDAEAERLKLARVAIEAKLKLGDLLRQKGDMDAALQAYREAIAIYDGMVKGRPAAKKAEQKDAPFKRGEEVTPAHTKRAITLGLEWLVNHQNKDGRWDADDFMRHDPANARCDGPGGAFYDVGITGLSLLALLKEPQAYKEPIRLGLKFLIENLDDTGCFGTRATQHFMYNTALATHAMCEAYRITRNKDYGKFAQQAVNFILKARNPYLAWRYQPRGGDNDTSVTAMCVMALRSAKFAGLPVDANAFEGARQWIDKMTEPEFGQVGYNMRGGTPARPQGLQDKFPPEKTHSMTAAGVLTRITLGEDPRKSGLIQKGAKLCHRIPPAWDVRGGFIDMYYWYLGTLAMFEVGGDSWENWRSNLHTALVGNQRRQGSERGSWDALGVWGPDGGRVYATAINVLSLQASLRPLRDRVFGAAR